MATRRYKISPGKSAYQIVDEVGAANNSDIVELTVDLAASVGGVTVSRDQVLQAIEQLEDYIMRGPWPPA